MNRLLLLPALALSLASCGPQDVMMGIATLGGVATTAGAGSQANGGAPAIDMWDRLDTRTRMAAAAFDRTTEAFESGKLPRSTSPDTAHVNFCAMVENDLAVVGADDVGGEAISLVCLAKAYLHKAKDAYQDNNAAAFLQHITKADEKIAELNKILTKAKGPVQ